MIIFLSNFNDFWVFFEILIVFRKYNSRIRINRFIRLVDFFLKFGKLLVLVLISFFIVFYRFLIVLYEFMFIYRR